MSQSKLKLNKTTLEYIKTLQKRTKLLDPSSSIQSRDYFCQNSLVWIQHPQKENHHFSDILYIPTYLRTHFRNMTEIDIQNLSSRFIATMNIDFYLAKYANKQEEQVAMKFAEAMHQIFLDSLKITFQNDFVLNIEEDLSTNTSDSDRLIRANIVKYKANNCTRVYSNIVITRQFKFGLHSDIFFFPLQQNQLDLTTTLNAIKTKYHVQGKKDKNLVVRFNCMNLELGQACRFDNFSTIKKQNSDLVEHLKELYLIENKGTQITDQLLYEYFNSQKNHPFFRDIRISFPLKKNATDFGYYTIIEKDVMVDYTREKQFQIQNNCYQRLKDCLFCRKKAINYDQTQLHKKMVSQKQINVHNSYQSLPSQEDRSLQYSFCNAIISIPLLKASLGTIIQLCIPIFFLSFLTLIQFLYSASSSQDQIRGLKIGASTLIIATYISFIYSMREVIPPTPSWSLFEMIVCLLAVSSLFPIIQVIYQQDITNTNDPFIANDVLFIIAFCLNTILCLLIVIVLIVISIYKAYKTKRHRSTNVKMENLIQLLTKRNFCLWRNHKCKEFMIKELNCLLKSRQVVISYDP